MTDWGSHGAGDDTETLTPLLVWGSGMRSSRHADVHIEQADLCPLMSYFLGLDYSINSVGRLPIDYLHPVDEDLLQAYLQNARQLLEQVHQQHDALKRRLFIFTPYELNEEKFFQRMQSVEGYMNVYQIRDDIKGSDVSKRLTIALFLFRYRFYASCCFSQSLLPHLSRISIEYSDQSELYCIALYDNASIESNSSIFIIDEFIL